MKEVFVCTNNFLTSNLSFVNIFIESSWICLIILTLNVFFSTFDKKIKKIKYDYKTFN